MISEGKGQSKKELEEGEPFVEISAQTAREQDLVKFGLTKQGVEEMHENRIKKTHNTDTHQNIR